MSTSRGEQDVVRFAENALRLVCASLPHLAGLAHMIRVYQDKRIATAAVTPSGRILVNPDWFGELTLRKATFVMAHELMHLCLMSYVRGLGTDARLFNVAHDYIINDILANEMHMEVPEGGLIYPGARRKSAEHIVQLIRDGQIADHRPATVGTMKRAMIDAGLVEPNVLTPLTEDVLTSEQERKLFPGSDPKETQVLQQEIEKAATRGLSLDMVRTRMDRIASAQGGYAGAAEDVVEALRTQYAPPWQQALQRWLEAVAPGARTYSRPSRREAADPDVVLPGRRREGWTMHVVLDTSGSMSHTLSAALGHIAAFAEAAGVSDVHLLQCDMEVTRDEWVEPEKLYSYEIAGFGGSDMTPAMRRLADDPEVEAALVLTDGFIFYPREPMPYSVLWVVTLGTRFSPPYGQVLAI